MYNFFNIILLFIAIGGVVYLIRKKSGFHKQKHIAVIDPVAQQEYAVTKNKNEAVVKLTLEEKIKLSWQFLVNIKNQVLSRFSEPDKAKLQQAGSVLTQNGMAYQHDVEQEAVTSQLSRAKSVEKSREQDQSVSR